MARVTINTMEIRACSLRHLGHCSKGPLHRHHKGNDGFLKFYHPAIARQYSLFLDCEDVCHYHHMAVHWAYASSGLQQGVDALSYKKVMERRVEFITLFARIKSGEVKLEKVGRFFRNRWKQRAKEWQTSKS